MDERAVSRRGAVWRLLGGAGLTAIDLGFSRRLWATPPASLRMSDGVLTIEFDQQMRSRLSLRGKPLTAMEPGEAVHLAGTGPAAGFTLRDSRVEPMSSPLGTGRRHVLTAVAAGSLEQRIAVTFLDRFPGAALLDISYRNISPRPLTVSGWHAATHALLAHPDGAWSFAGASYPDRRDWAQRVAPGFAQRNFMGMSATDYGGGTPVAVVWRRDAGLAVGHLDTVPRLVSFPVAAQPTGTRIGIAGDDAAPLDAGGALRLPTVFVMAHDGDYFRPLDTYRRMMAERGLAAPRIPETSYAPIWCAWGYQRDFTAAQIEATLPKAKALGLEWAVLDDGWQTSEGDWKIDRAKFPRGAADLRAFASRIKAAGMRPRLWFSPLAVDPGTDLLRDHGDMLLLDRDGAAQNVSWWNSYTLCPAYPPTIAYYQRQVATIIGEWGFEGLKLDGQHLNGVAPCYNPAHNHARPEESFEKLQDFWKALYDTAVAANPEAVVEICPCGDAFAFHNIPAMNNTPASDPTSSWQVRLKGKTFKALMGPQAPYSGDHVELSDRGDDFASSYGVGAILSTKFTWPRDISNPIEKLPPGGFVLTAAKEAAWRRWIALYRANMLPRGEYLGGLYDIGFDKPEAHVVATGERLHYAFFADRWRGPIPLRGLRARRYALRDPLTGRALGAVTGGGGATLDAEFTHFLLVEAVPADGPTPA